MSNDVTSNRIAGLESLLKGHGGKGPPPVDKWNPPYCGDIGIWNNDGPPLPDPRLA